jgi:hypothetical protein
MTQTLNSIYGKTILARPAVTLFFLSLILVGFSMGLSDFKIDASTDALLLESDKDLRSFREMSMRYKTKEFLFIAVTPKKDILSKENIDFITRLRDDLAAVPNVLDVISMLDVPLVTNKPGTLAQAATNFQTLRLATVDLEKARIELTESPVYKDLIASADGTVTAIQLFLNPHPLLPRLRKVRDDLLYQKHSELGLTDEQVIELSAIEPNYQQAKFEAEENAHNAIADIRDILQRYEQEGTAKLYLGGLPMITDDLISFITRDLITFGSGVFIFLIIMLSVIFREVRWVVLPFASCIYSGTLMLGLLGLLGWKVTIISSNFLALMLIITMSMNIHLVVRYRELYRDYPEASQRDLVRLTVQNMARPCFYTAITTIIAFASLVISGIRPVIDFGLMMTVGLIVVFLTSFTLFPTLLLLTKKTTLKREDSNSYPLTAVLGRFTENHGRAVLVVSFCVGLVGLTGMQKLEVENSFISYFHEDTEIYQGLKLIDEKLGGTTPLDIILKFPETIPEIDFGFEEDDLAALFGDISDQGDKADSWFTTHKVDRIKAVHDYLDNRPEIGKVLSLASGIRVAEQLNDGNEFTPFELNILYKRIPAPVRATSIDPYISIYDDEARVSARIFDSMPNLRRNELLKEIQSDLETVLGLTPEEYKITGLLVLYNNVLQTLFNSQILTLGAVMLGIMGMLLILFWSVKVAMVGILPNALAATAILGLMGWMAIPLDVMTITIAAITVGIAVDDCIHYLYRYKTELPTMKDPIKTMHYCHDNIARAAFYTTLTITIGFSILLWSNFIPTILFGVLTAIAMIVALLAALTLMPKLILMLKPFPSD